MEIIKKIDDLRKLAVNYKKLGLKIAITPTMGALHEGHLALIRKAKEQADIVIVSIFVNKKQFNNSEDYEKYPRNFERDIEILHAHSIANIVFIPEMGEIYPADIENFRIEIGKIGDVLCGKYRIGHFSGVAMIVMKLFNITQADYAIFGEKDFQQLLIIKKLVEEFNFPIKIVQVPVIRENGKIALSSRNKRLSDEDKNIANEIFLVLYDAINRVTDQNVRIADFLEGQRKIIEKFPIKLEYLEIRNEKDLSLAQNLNEARLFIAYEISGVRLIDNIKI